MSQVIKISIPDELAKRIEARRGDQSMQEYTLAALRSAIYGSPVEVELRAQIAQLLELIPKLARAPRPERIVTEEPPDWLADQLKRFSDEEPDPPSGVEDTRIGW